MVTSNPIVQAQHQETGRMWEGPRDQIPRGYAEVDYRPSNQNTGHGHVFPRPDGMKARCGGPAICPVCAADQVRKGIMVHEAAEHRPSKESLHVRFVKMWHDLIESAAKNTLRYTRASLLFIEADKEIERLQQHVAALERQQWDVASAIFANDQAAGKHWAQGVKVSISRDGVTLATTEPKPAHEREPPHCSTCGCGMPAEPPSEGQRDAKRLKDYFDNANRITHPSLYYSSADPFAAWCGEIDQYMQDRASVTKKPGISEPPVVVDDGEEFDADDVFDEPAYETFAAHPVMNRDVTVCSACERACCRQGEFMCDYAKGAGVTYLTYLTVKQLHEKPRGENAEYWFKDPDTGEINKPLLAAYRVAVSENGDL